MPPAWMVPSAHLNLWRKFSVIKLNTILKFILKGYLHNKSGFPPLIVHK